MGRFMILDMDVKEVVQDGRYYSPGWNKNVAESFAIQDTL